MNESRFMAEITLDAGRFMSKETKCVTKRDLLDHSIGFSGR